MIFLSFQRIVIPKAFTFANLNVFSSIGTVVINSPKNVMYSTNRSFGNGLQFPYNTLSQNRLQIHYINQMRMLSGMKGIQENISVLQMKKRPLRKKRPVVEDEERPLPGFWNVKAVATAEEYNLEELMDGLLEQNLYIPRKICTTSNSLADVIHAIAKYEVGHEPREIYFFREGAVVMWNITELESGNLLQFLKAYEDCSYSDSMVHAESELMSYTYTDAGKKSHLQDGIIILAADATDLDKYTFSNAIVQSVKLGIWETSLDRYVNSIEFITEDLKAGRKIRMSREEVLRKQGELFALRHLINLSSDLLDTPDFYWEREELENLYQQTCSYFSISKRTRVMNEKLNHCVELVELLSSHLSDRHHVRLEWMIIILIMVEVVFETIHYIDRYFGKKGDSNALAM
ncbi:required for meiotic nuclear division protein 1 homolog isoform X2 [Cephus cinctus]|uniref:Required for meiotic nuclear division protein 1 homolog isoform X2 n=1 Tax=Cephus cinctus TaxID=211228 RepID=A0AAJ7BS58_CEPCN|nr:required for meiotic nuclear division protein 1 homolog isoform X2 [Cephus cinctus]